MDLSEIWLLANPLNMEKVLVDRSSVGISFYAVILNELYCVSRCLAEGVLTDSMNTDNLRNAITLRVDHVYRARFVIIGTF